VESSEQSSIMELNVKQNRRFDEYDERIIARKGHNFDGVHLTSKWKPKKLHLPKSSYGAQKLIHNQDSQASLRKIDTREIITSILGTGFLHLLLFLKQLMTDMYYGVHQIYFFR
jgi:hypothetical protein